MAIFRKLKRLVGAGLLAACSTGAAWAGTSPRAAATPPSATVMRRMNLIVHDLDASLQLYRDALGLVVVSDVTSRRPRDAASDADAEQILRIVTLRDKDDATGLIGLVHYAKPAKTVRYPERVDRNHVPGDIILIFSAPQIDEIYEKMIAVPGVIPILPPHEVPATLPDGTKGTEIYGFIHDPDGNFVEINRPSDPRVFR